MTARRGLFGVPKELAAADRAAGLARIGGPHHGGYHLEGFVLATRAIVDHAIDKNELEQLAMPCVHNLRHTVESMLKSLIEDLHRLACLGDEDVSGRQSFRPHPLSKPNHDLPQLVDTLRKLLHDSGYPMPEQLAALALELAKVEDGDETRWRYERGRSKRPYAEKSFPTELLLPIVAWQRQLESIWTETFLPAPEGSDRDASLVEELYYAEQGYLQNRHWEFERWHERCAHCGSDNRFWTEKGWSGNRCGECGSLDVRLERIE